MKIISGGQTGVDRAALDVALKYNLPCGGWCPAGRLDEFGRIPEHYPVQELPVADFATRTLQNVIASDATVIFYRGALRGGSEHTLRCCLDQTRPHLLIDGISIPIAEASKRIVGFLQAHSFRILNIAGPRQSEWPGGYEYAFAVLESSIRSSAG